MEGGQSVGKPRLLSGARHSGARGGKRRRPRPGPQGARRLASRRVGRV